MSALSNLIASYGQLVTSVEICKQNTLLFMTFFPLFNVVYSKQGGLTSRLLVCYPGCIQQPKLLIHDIVHHLLHRTPLHP